MCGCVPGMQQHGHIVREDILADQRNHGPVRDAALRLVVLHLDYEEFPTIRWGVCCGTSCSRQADSRQRECELWQQADVCLWVCCAAFAGSLLTTSTHWGCRCMCLSTMQESTSRCAAAVLWACICAQRTVLLGSGRQSSAHSCACTSGGSVCALWCCCCAGVQDR